MASDLEAARLARLARALNVSSRLPPLILMTDELRLPDPVAAVERLARGCAVIVRHRNAVARAALAKRLRPVAKRCGILLLISEDGPLANAIGADGLHLPERHARTAAHWKAIRPRWLITAAAHSGSAVSIASRAGADAVLLAPVFATRSHPERVHLGVFRTLGIAGGSALPVYALGGINDRTARRLARSSVAGFAAIAALSESHNE